MVFGCCAKVSKVLLFVINIIFFLTGAAVLGVGLWLKFDKNVENILKATFLNDVSSFLAAAAYILIAFGALVFVVGFCGCCGAIKESKCLIGTYLAFIVVVLVGELAGGIYAYTRYESVLGDVKGAVALELLKYNAALNRPEVEQPWNFLMIHFRCCGWDDKSFANDASKSTNVCCYTQDRDAYVFGTNITSAGDCTKNGDGKGTTCFDALTNILKDNAVVAIAVVGGIAGLEILVFILALCFCCGLNKD